MTDLPDRILAAIETDSQRDAHDHDCLWSIDRNGGWCDKDCRKRTLRHCEADKRTVERHSLIRGKSVLRNGEFVDYCAACVQPIPCPDLLDRAAAYGVPTTPTGETT